MKSIIITNTKYNYPEKALKAMKVGDIKYLKILIKKGIIAIV